MTERRRIRHRGDTTPVSVSCCTCRIFGKWRIRRIRKSSLQFAKMKSSDLCPLSLSGWSLGRPWRQLHSWCRSLADQSSVPSHHIGLGTPPNSSAMENLHRRISISNTWWPALPWSTGCIALSATLCRFRMQLRSLTGPLCIRGTTVSSPPLDHLLSSWLGWSSRKAYFLRLAYRVLTLVHLWIHHHVFHECSYSKQPQQRVDKVSVPWVVFDVIPSCLEWYLLSNQQLLEFEVGEHLNQDRYQIDAVSFENRYATLRSAILTYGCHNNPGK